MTTYDPNWRQKALDAGQDQNGPQYADMRATESSSSNGSPSGSGFDMGAYTKALNNLTTSNKASTDQRFQDNKNELTGFINDFKTNTNGLTDSTYSKYGIPQQVNIVNALDSRIKDLTGNLSGTGSEGYASGAQVDKAINTKYLPTYNAANANLLNSTNVAQGEIASKLKPFETQATLLTDRMAREATGYSQEQQRELDSILGQINAGVTLTKAQMDRATALAAQENEFNIAKYQADKTNRYKVVGDTVYDTETGQYKVPGATIGTNGSTSSRTPLDQIFG